MSHHRITNRSIRPPALWLGLGLALSQLAACSSRSASSAHQEVVLGTAESFSILGGSTVTNTGPTTISGDLGVSPGLAVVGFPPGVVIGAIHAGDAAALQAQADVTVAYNMLAGQACNQDLTGQDLGGLTLTSGVYCFANSAQLTGTLTLDAQGDPDAEFVFQIGSSLTTASSSSVAVINGAQGCHTFWQVGSSATLGTVTSFTGTIVALTSITLTTGTQLIGRALARNGAVTMDTNHVEQGACITAGTDAGSIDSAGPAIDADGPAIDADGPAIDAAGPAIDAAGPAIDGAGPTTDGGVGPDAHQCSGSTCIDLQTDRNHCGTLGHQCSWDAECVHGVCSCMDTMCGGICVDLQQNPDHCGVCGGTCGSGQWCDDGACVTACAGTVCNGWCTDLMTNEDACGACGVQCGSAESCQGGVCVCTGTMCDGACVDLGVDGNHCGACGNICGVDTCCAAGECTPL